MTQQEILLFLFAFVLWQGIKCFMLSSNPVKPELSKSESFPRLLFAGHDVPTRWKLVPHFDHLSPQPAHLCRAGTTPSHIALAEALSLIRHTARLHRQQLPESLPEIKCEWKRHKREDAVENAVLCYRFCLYVLFVWCFFKNVFSVKCGIETMGLDQHWRLKLSLVEWKAGSAPFSRTHPLGVAPERGSRSRSELASAAAAPLTEPAN